MRKIFISILVICGFSVYCVADIILEEEGSASVAGAKQVAISGDYAYIASALGLYIIDIHDPKNPKYIKFFISDDVYSLKQIRVVDNYAYVLKNSGTFMIIDITDKNNPIYLSSAYLDTALDLEIFGNYAYIAGSSDGVIPIDIGDKSHPVIGNAYVSEWYINPPSLDVAVDKNGRLYSAESYYGLKIFTYPEDIFWGNYIKKVKVLDNYAYVLDNYDSLTVVDVENKEYPSLMGSYNIGGGDFEIAGNYIYTISQYGSSYIKVVNMQDKANMKLDTIYTNDNLYNIKDIALSKNYLYVVQSGVFTVLKIHNSNIRNFVKRFYLEILGREADVNGLDSWEMLLANGTKTGEDIAKGFIFSEEFTNKNLTDVDFLDVLYKAFFDREADAGGLNQWLNQLESGASREKVLDGFLGSQEFKNLSNAYGIIANTSPVERFVRRFYEQCLGRTPDDNGLKSWVTALKNGTKTGADVARGFVWSQEFINQSLNNTVYLNVLYKAFFDRTPDAEGFRYWIDKLSHGTTREQVLEGFLGAQEFINLANTYEIKPF